MTEFPFQLLIRSTCPQKRTESVSCTALLRTIPGRRQVYDALWNNKAVIAKVFCDKISAKRHLKREWSGLSTLARRGLSSPAALFYGRTENGRWALVTEKIADSSTAVDLFNKAGESGKLDLLLLICRELAKQHAKGVLQNDLHLGNFAVDGEKVFVLDAGQMKFFSRPLSRKKSTSQLALLACYLPASDTDCLDRLCEEYFTARGWCFEKSDRRILRKQLIAHRKIIARKTLRKCLRTSKRFLRVHARKYLAVFDRDFCQAADPFDFIAQIDALMDKGQILKNGSTCYVSRLTWNGKDIVIKRYNHKGFIHSLRHTIKRSRARRAWLHAHLLGTLNIATPTPLAFIEQYKGWLTWKSYLVTEYVEAERLANLLQDSKTTQQQRSRLIAQVEEMLDKLAKCRITHGDLKHSNILITHNGPVFTDLDGVKTHKWNTTYQWRRARDLARFTKNECVPLSVSGLSMKLRKIFLPKSEKSIVDDFHSLYYNSRRRTWNNTFWLGVPCQKCPLDLWVYQEIISDFRPDIIIECGTAAGGTTLFLACLCELVGNGKVISIDIEDRPKKPQHERITYLSGSDISEEIIQQVKKFLNNTDRVMVILDSDHAKDHVLQELRVYSSLITPGSYIIVEDSNIGGHPVKPKFGYGPMEAIEEFLAENSNFVIDPTKEKFFLTFNPNGYLKRIS